MQGWPREAGELEVLQREVAARWLTEPRWVMPADRPLRLAGVFVAGPRGEPGGDDAERGWAAAVVVVESRVVESNLVEGRLEAPYVAGLLALREGRLLEGAVRGLRQAPDVLIVNATGRDHPRRAGLALHLGAVCGLPTIGVTDRPLVAGAAEPEPGCGATAELRLEGGELAGYVVRTRPGTRPVVVHAGWRVDADTARAVALSAAGPASRTPLPLREARRLARTTRASA